MYISPDIDRETERQSRDRETERQRDRETERDRDRQLYCMSSASRQSALLAVLVQYGVQREEGRGER